MNKLNKLWILLIDNILVYNQRKRHIKYHLSSVSSFCAVVNKDKKCLNCTQPTLQPITFETVKLSGISGLGWKFKSNRVLLAIQPGKGK